MRAFRRICGVLASRISAGINVHLRKPSISGIDLPIPHPATEKPRERAGRTRMGDDTIRQRPGIARVGGAIDHPGDRIGGYGAAGKEHGNIEQITMARSDVDIQKMPEDQ